MYVHTYICTHVYVRTYARLCTYVRMHVCICMYVCMFVHVCSCISRLPLLKHKKQTNVTIGFSAIISNNNIWSKFLHNYSIQNVHWKSEATHIVTLLKLKYLRGHQ